MSDFLSAKEDIYFEKLRWWKLFSITSVVCWRKALMIKSLLSLMLFVSKAGMREVDDEVCQSSGIQFLRFFAGLIELSLFGI